MKKNSLLAITMALTLTMLCENTTAQIIPCRPEVEGLHFTSPMYKYSPVYFSNMPYDVLISYIVADSILSYAGVKEIASDFNKRFRKNQISYDNDTLNYAYKYMYKIMDYDPLLF